MTFPLRHIPSSLPFFVGPSLGPPHLLPFIGQLSVFCWPRVFSFRLSKRGGAPSPLSPTDAWERVRRGRTAAAASADRPSEGGQRAAAAVESRDREQFVSQSHGWAAGTGGFTRPPPSACPPGRPAHPRRPAFPRSAFHRTTDDGGGMRNEEEREIKRGTVAHSPDIRRTTREK